MPNAVRKIVKIIDSRFLVPFVDVFPAWVTPNLITSFRLILIFPIIITILTQAWPFFIFLYLVSLFSDSFDGALSRKRNLHTKFGSAFDPVVDKLLHATLFIFLIPFAPILISAIILADFIILIGGWLTIKHFNRIKKDLPIKGANSFGKLKVLFQGALIINFYCYQIFFPTALLWQTAIFLTFCTLILSALSIIKYAFTLMRIKYN